jgi:hypothetical protein
MLQKWSNCSARIAASSRPEIVLVGRIKRAIRWIEVITPVFIKVVATHCMYLQNLLHIQQVSRQFVVVNYVKAQWMHRLTFTNDKQIGSTGEFISRYKPTLH